MEYRVVRISKVGINFLADFDGEDHLWSPDKGDTLIFRDEKKAIQAANVPGIVRLEGKTRKGWSVDYNDTLKNAH